MRPPRSGAGTADAALASVATVSFLASRAAPTGGFVVALAGGVAMARAGQRLGPRRGYGASIAAMLESVAIMGPARFSVPFTQAITAPMLGAFEARGVHPLLQGVACGLIRLVHNALGTAFLIWVILGGLDAYAGSYDTLLGSVLPKGEAAALVLTGAGLAAWALFATAVQVVVYRRGLAAWPEAETPAEDTTRVEPPDQPGGRIDPRAAALAAAFAFAILLAGTDWVLLGGVCAWLAVVTPVARRADRNVLVTGGALAAVLAGGALAASLLAGLGLDLALRRALRAALLVAVATWLRAAAGSEGLREVARRSLGRLRRLPSLPEAADVLDHLGSDRRLAAAGRALVDALGPVRKSPLPVLDAVLGWVAAQSGSFAPRAVGAHAPLAARPLDALLVAGALLPALGLLVR